jgi:hypothetical protein
MLAHKIPSSPLTTFPSVPESACKIGLQIPATRSLVRLSIQAIFTIFAIFVLAISQARTHLSSQPSTSMAHCPIPQWSCWRSAIGIQVFAQQRLITTCTGVAVSSRHILTAAHCTQSLPSRPGLTWRFSQAEQLEFRAPQTSLMSDLFVQDPPYRQHPRYNPTLSRYQNDWAIIEVAHDFPSVRIWPRPWPRSKGQTLHRIGYGARVNANGDMENRRTWITSFLNHDLHASDSGIETRDILGVPGDSGGPLYVWHVGEAWLLGLHSTWDAHKGLSLAPRLP